MLLQNILHLLKYRILIRKEKNQIIPSWEISQKRKKNYCFTYDTDSGSAPVLSFVPFKILATGLTTGPPSTTAMFTRQETSCSFARLSLVLPLPSAQEQFIPMGLYSNQSPADSLTFTKAHSFPVVCYAGRSMDSSSGLIIVLKSVVGKKKMAFWRWRMIMMVQHWTGCWETIGKFFINDKWIISSWEHFKWNSKHLHYNKDDLEWLYKE